MCSVLDVLKREGVIVLISSEGDVPSKQSRDTTDPLKITKALLVL